MAKVVDILFRVKDNATASLEKMRTSLADSNKQWTRAGREIQRTGRQISRVGSGLTKSLTVPIVGAGTVAVSKFAEVDKTMSLVNSTMGNSSKSAGILNKAMENAAANSTFGMKDAADAALNFARGSWDAEQAADALSPAMNLAAGEGGNLDTVSAGLMATMNSFKAAPKEAAKYADVFANACNNSALDVDSLSNAMSVAAPIFKSGGLGVQDAALAMGVMANAGVDANVGANALKTGLARLASPAKDGAMWMEKLGINAFDSNGNMKDMATLQGELSGAFGNLSAQEKEAAASAIFGKNQMSPWLSLIGAAPKDVQKLNASLGENGTATDMASAMMSGFGGSIEKLKSSFDVFMTSMGKPIGEVLTPFINKIQGVIDKLNGMDDAQKKQLVKYGLMAAAVGPVVLGFGKVVTGVGGAMKMVGSFGNLMFRLPTIAAKVTGAFSGVTSIGGVFAGIGKSFLAVLGPAGTVVAVLAAVAIAGVLVWKNWDKIRAGGQKAFKALTPVINAFKMAFNIMKNGVVSGFNAIKNSVAKVAEPIKKRLDSIKKHFNTLTKVPAFQKFVQLVQETFVAGLQTKLSLMAGIFNAVFTTVTGLISAAVSTIGGLINGIMTVFDGLITFLTGVFSGNWKKAWEGIKTIFKGIVESLASVVKAPINAVVAVINGAINGINSISISIPDWVPKFGGNSYSPNIPTVPQLAKGTPNWIGGMAQINERGGEIVDLPRGSRVYPHDVSVRQAYNDGKRSSSGGINIAKLADSIIIREEADIDKMCAKLIHALEIYKADAAQFA